jgi:hypothetical protein
MWILKHFVQYFWHYETTDKDFQSTVLPDGYFYLIAELENED